MTISVIDLLIYLLIAAIAAIIAEPHELGEKARLRRGGRVS